MTNSMLLLPTQAGHCYRRVLTLKPAQPWAPGQLLGLSIENRDEDDALIHTARCVLQDPDAPHGARALIGYGPGRRHDRHGEYDAAFETTNRARRAQAGAFDTAEFEPRVKRSIDVLSEELFARRKRLGIGTDLPVFIVGMPRSGTKLTEQIPDSHPLMRGASEVPYLSDAGARSRSVRNPRCLDFHRSRRAVRVSSRWQVYQPIYAPSVGRWRRYAKHVAPLLRHFPQGDRRQ